MKQNILITGAGGFIGSHLAERLLRDGARVTALVRYTSSGTIGWLTTVPPARHKGLRIIHGDIRDPDICADAVKGNRIVFHLAAQIAIPYSYIAPRDFVAVNALGTANMLQAARSEGVKKFVQVSTSEVYGTAQYVPIDENHPQVAQSPYSASKIAADKMAESFYRSFGLPVVIVRPFNTYGPRQSARAVIPTIIIQALRGRIIRLGNIDTSRDLNYVEDTVAGMIAAARSEKTTGRTANIATGNDFTIEELVGFVSEILGKKLSIKTERRRVRPSKSEVRRLQGDASLAHELFGYAPKHTIMAGLKKTIRFFEKHLDSYAKEDYQL
ncbi:MAG: GDP-mannose 4,6-dehydratase [candidate division Zixibacteria bacterium]|nr:GDP-mannose 4,6-dehydratase [candidate division Zixibacteria bacterium]